MRKCVCVLCCADLRVELFGEGSREGEYFTFPLTVNEPVGSPAIDVPKVELRILATRMTKLLEMGLR